VAAAYQWEVGSGQLEENQSLSTVHRPLNLEHGFHQTAQGVRFTVSEAARREILSRLLKLNHERYEEEMKNAEVGSQNEKRKGKGKHSKKTDSADGQIGMF
jgi:hypothetical protein